MFLKSGPGGEVAGRFLGRDWGGEMNGDWD